MFTILIGALLFGYFLTITQTPQKVTEFLTGLGIGPYGVLALIMLMYLVLGCLMDALAMIILTIPIVFPVIKALGFDPIWFGVIIVMTVELGLIHPPVGMNVFVIKSVLEDVKISTIFYRRDAVHHHRPDPAGDPDCLPDHRALAALAYVGPENDCDGPARIVGAQTIGPRGRFAMERSFKKEVQSLRLGDGETFHGEGILAVTKALLQSGVSYVGGYQGAPVSHLLDVLVDAEDIMAELGVHVETCTNEASAAAMLGASINYPMRGAVTWKSIVGTNVASDALSNLSSPGVIGGAMIILGEDYGEGASVIQERSYAYALKSSMWLLDPRPDLPSIVRIVEKGFELSEASHAPVMLELRIRACHVTGSFAAKDNRKARDLRPQPHRTARRISTMRGCRIRRSPSRRRS